LKRATAFAVAPASRTRSNTFFDSAHREYSSKFLASALLVLAFLGSIAGCDRFISHGKVGGQAGIRPDNLGSLKIVNLDECLLAMTRPFQSLLAPNLLTFSTERRCAHTHASLEDR
jgi:hypothetical protein